MEPYDIVFIGHISVDIIERFAGETSVETGGAAFYSSMAACHPGLGIAVLTRMSPEHDNRLDPLKERGIHVDVQKSPRTSHLRVVHGTDNPDQRDIYQTENAGFFEEEKISFTSRPRSSTSARSRTGNSPLSSWRRSNRAVTTFPSTCRALSARSNLKAG